MIGEVFSYIWQTTAISFLVLTGLSVIFPKFQATALMLAIVYGVWLLSWALLQGVLVPRLVTGLTIPVSTGVIIGINAIPAVLSWALAGALAFLIGSKAQLGRRITLIASVIWWAGLVLPLLTFNGAMDPVPLTLAVLTLGMASLFGLPLAQNSSDLERIS